MTYSQMWVRYQALMVRHINDLIEAVTREAAIEAMARSAFRRAYADQDWVEDDDLWRGYWDKERLEHPYGDDTAEDCEAQLDGLLDYLTANAEMWQRQAYVPAECDHVLKFIDVLRQSPEDR
jgi:hypothetical protein